MSGQRSPSGVTLRRKQDAQRSGGTLLLLAPYSAGLLHDHPGVSTEAWVMAMCKAMRTILVVLLTAAVLLLPSTPVGAAGSIASCFHSWTDSVSPGITTAAQRSNFTSHGETWALICQGMIRGQQVTGPGTFGEEGFLDGSCSSGSGIVTFSFTIPTTDGEQKFRLTFRFAYGPGAGSSFTDVFPGLFVFTPKTGDCVTAPVTEFNVARTGLLVT
jgi:hypothetical protein